jgi:hypothetical protein
LSDYPVSISGGCARAVLAGRKSMVRQVASDPQAPCPLGVPGDRLWVREPWTGLPDGGIRYQADEPDLGRDADAWQPARTMSRQISRICLEVEAVRLERLQAIPPTDLALEGSLWLPPATPGETPRQGFARWWDSLHLRDGTRWADDPWVWVVSFHRVEA